MTTMAEPSKVLIVDDDPAIRRFLRTSLIAEGYQVAEAESGAGALNHLRRGADDILLLDLGLPDIDGSCIIEHLRQEGSALPIVVLSSLADEAVKVRVLDLGADDYLTKPFGIDELLARIRLALRHRLQQGGEQPVFRCGELAVDLVRRIVTLQGIEVKLTPREYDLLRLFVAHAGKVLTHRFIMHEVWNGEADIQYLRIYVRSLRQKIEVTPEYPSCILTEQGVGYRMRTSDCRAL
jgi:two-component system KDP operon response regulator KdpE